MCRSAIREGYARDEDRERLEEKAQNIRKSSEVDMEFAHHISLSRTVTIARKSIDTVLLSLRSAFEVSVS